MSDEFLIQGGRALRGEIEARGAKNAAFPILAASLLTEEECRISNLPLIEDVFRIIEILESMGAKISWEEERTLKINTTDINPSRIRKDLVGFLRGSVLLLGPLLARFGKVKLFRPGGCIIGVRPIDTHLDGFSQLGVKISKERNHYILEANQRKSDTKIILNEFSVTATENLMLFSSLIPGKTIIKIADEDYQVQELAKFLKKMGVKIKRAGSHEIAIEGSKKLKGVRHHLIYDPIEAGTFMLMAAATRGNVLVKNVEISFLELFLKKLKDFRIPHTIQGNSVRILPCKSIKIDKIQSLPYPGLPTDLQSAFGVLATQSKGSTLIHDPLYEGRLKYLEELNKMGAEIYFADPHRAIINGPTQLYGTELRTLDLRGGAALIMASLIAKGQTIIHNVYQIDRGYEKIEERLQKLGADIRRTEYSVH